MTDDQLDEWTPEAMANFEAAHARLVSTLDQFTAGLRTAMPTRAEGPELESLREQVDRALVDLDRASGDLTGEYFATIDPVFEDDEDSEGADASDAGEPEDEAGLGVSVIWRLDLRVDSPSALRARATAMYAESYPDWDEKELADHTAGVGAALQGVTDLAGMEALMGTDGITPLGGIRAYVVTEDLIDGPDSIELLLDPDADGPTPWTRERGGIFLPVDGTVGMTEGFHFS